MSRGSRWEAGSPGHVVCVPGQGLFRAPGPKDFLGGGGRGEGLGCGEPGACLMYCLIGGGWSGGQRPAQDTSRVLCRVGRELASCSRSVVWCGMSCVGAGSIRCGCIIGKDYPYPIVDHTAISKVNMGRMKVGIPYT